MNNDEYIASIDRKRLRFGPGRIHNDMVPKLLADSEFAAAHPRLELTVRKRVSQFSNCIDHLIQDRVTGGGVRLGHDLSQRLRGFMKTAAQIVHDLRHGNRAAAQHVAGVPAVLQRLRDRGEVSREFGGHQSSSPLSEGAGTPCDLSVDEAAGSRPDSPQDATPEAGEQP